MFCHLSNINSTACSGFPVPVYRLRTHTAVTRGEAAPLICIMHPCIAASCIWGTDHVMMLPRVSAPCPLSRETRAAPLLSPADTGRGLGRKSPGPLNVNYHADKSQHYSYCPWPGLASPHMYTTQLLVIAVADCSATLSSASHVARYSRYRGITGDTTVDVERCGDVEI